ncbi:ABC transporter family protein [Yersinia rochesterensis]|uniref:ABC transporter family protein n=1 Tax=Yersinia rochesterensis TaxID=1604335 RepID=A0ABM5SLH3_9GAMM|nr:ABC transporter ATP-binding protein [Yersinia rochesterensis]AIN19026.1 ABC transporter family protein [Yersinia rochesterensis]AJI88447.1 ABC transporter family protein [Yersinia frederiksenii Y225]AJJ35351.1 ABC transporter family protein [Yersinia rochesterensis]CRY65305.1 putative iron ABC transporter ATP-binding protein [Yersinia kristensenii]
MIEITDINKKYQSTTVLNNINESIPSGGVTSIIGPNGAGKSTLLSIMSRLLTPDLGRVQYNGLDVATTSDDKLATILSVLRQENHFTSRLTVADLVGFGRYPYSKGRLNENDRQHIDAAMEFLNLMPLKDRYLDELSGGQRQRAYVAMVLCQDTKYILLDEPLNNLDMKHCVAMMKQLRRAADELNKTIILVIHDINFASAYSDHIIAMKDGEVIYRGAPEEIMQPDILEEIFDIKIRIEKVQDQHIAVYYR